MSHETMPNYQRHLFARQPEIRQHRRNDFILQRLNWGDYTAYWLIHHGADDRYIWSRINITFEGRRIWVRELEHGEIVGGHEHDIVEARLRELI